MNIIDNADEKTKTEIQCVLPGEVFFYIDKNYFYVVVEDINGERRYVNVTKNRLVGFNLTSLVTVVKHQLTVFF